MWHRVGRNGQADEGYSITNGALTLIVPHTQGAAGVAAALAYLNRQHPAPSLKAKRRCQLCGGRY